MADQESTPAESSKPEALKEAAELVFPTEEFHQMFGREVTRVKNYVDSYPVKVFPGQLIIISQHQPETGMQAMTRVISLGKDAPAVMEQMGHELASKYPNFPAICAFLSHEALRSKEDLTVNPNAPVEDGVLVSGQTLDGRVISTFFQKHLDEKGNLQLGEHSPIVSGDDLRSPAASTLLWKFFLGYTEETAKGTTH